MTSGWKANALGMFTVTVLLIIAGYAALFIAPDERTMHAIQRIFYFHAPAGITSFSAFLIAFIANIAYLAKRQPKWDWLGVSAVEVGVAFCTVNLITGPIWAHPVWGVWWTWDARLTLTLVLWLLYVTYLVLRTLMADPERRAMFCAIFGIFAYLDVPLVYLSIRIWRTQHPQPVVLGGAGSGLEPTMRNVFLFCILVLNLLMALLIRQRYRVERLRHEVEELRVDAENRLADRAARA
ncbi:MAG: cytochrome c biogenesis protein [Candidatus Acidiferrales bacterium]